MFLVRGEILLLLITIISVKVFCQPVFDYNQKCKTVYTDVLKLKIPYAQKVIQEEKLKEPDNFAWLLLQSYCDFLYIFINEDYKAFEQLEQDFDKRLELIDQLDNNNPWKKFAKAEMYIHKATARAKFEEFFTTVWEIRKANKLLQENNRLFPDFKPNQKSLSIFNAVFGTIPDKYKFGARLLGFKGNVAEGMQQIEDYLVYAKEQNMFYDEMLLLHNFFLIYLDKDFENAYQIASTQLKPKESLLHNFIAAEIAYKTGRIEEAIEVVENHPKNKDYMPYPFMDYYLGIFKMTQLNTSEAIPLITSFLTKFKGRHYIKEAWYRLALCHLIEKDTLSYFRCLKNVETTGYQLYDADRQSYANSVSGEMPNTKLLKARLLNDGGYYNKSLAILMQMDTPGVKYKDNLERLYRLGRVYEALNETEKALQYYKKVVDFAHNDKYYFGGRACLQLGNMYKRLKEFELADTYYKMTFRYNKHPYKDSFEQQAKAGISNH